MLTRRSRVLVSLFAVLALGACTTRTLPARDGLAAAASPRPTAEVRFDNESREPVVVYLVGETQEWRLGRVEAGARVWLPLPRRAFASAGQVRLVAIAGATRSLRAARDDRAVAALAQPLASLLEQRWVYAPGQLTPLWADGLGR